MDKTSSGANARAKSLARHKVKLKTYRVRYVPRNRTEMISIEVSAESREAARLKTIKKGRLIDVKRRFHGLSMGLSLKASERYIMLHRLGTMSASKIGEGQAIKMMSETFGGNIRRVAAELYRRLENADGLVDAMESMGTRVFPIAIISLIKAGIEGGNTGRALIDAAEFERELHDIKKDSQWTLWASVGAFLMAGGFILFSNYYLSPMLKGSDLFKNSPVDTASADMMAQVTGGAMLVIMVAFVLLLMLGSVLRAAMPRLADNIILKIPLYRDLVLARNSYATMYGLAMLMEAGVREEEALKVTMINARKGALRDDLERAWIGLYRKGDTQWALLLESLHPMDRAAMAMSDSRDQLAVTLHNLSTQYRRLYAQRIKMISPLLYTLAAVLLSFAGYITYVQTVEPMMKMTQGMIQ